MVNKVILLGNLAADPEVKATPKGTYVAKMRLATNSYVGKDEGGNRKEQTEFHHLVAFGKLAEFAGQYMRKGRSVYAEGSYARARGRTPPARSTPAPRSCSTSCSLWARSRKTQPA